MIYKGSENLWICIKRKKWQKIRKNDKKHVILWLEVSR